MGRAVKAKWVKWFDEQSEDEKRVIALNAIERLIQIDEVSFREQESFDEEVVKECLYWDSCGEDLRTPF